MKTLLKNCDIVATGPSGFYVLKNAFCGIDNDRICYLGEAEPAEKYHYVKDMGGKVL